MRRLSASPLIPGRPTGPGQGRWSCYVKCQSVGAGYGFMTATRVNTRAVLSSPGGSIQSLDSKVKVGETRGNYNRELL